MTPAGCARANFDAPPNFYFFPPVVYWFPTSRIAESSHLRHLRHWIAVNGAPPPSVPTDGPYLFFLPTVGSVYVFCLYFLTTFLLASFHVYFAESTRRFDPPKQDRNGKIGPACSFDPPKQVRSGQIGPLKSILLTFFLFRFISKKRA